MTSKEHPAESKQIRDRPGLAPGDKAGLVPSGEAAVAMRRRRRLRLDEVFGSLPSNGVTLTAEQMDDAIAEAVAERHARSMRWSRSTKATSPGH